MKPCAKSLAAMMLMVLLAGCESETGKDVNGKAASSSDVSYFFGARIIPGDGSPAMEDMSFIVINGKFTAIEKRRELNAPKGSARIELTGRTVTPVFANLQAQPGMNNGAQYGPKNYNRDSLTADLSRYAYYGVMAVLTAGTDSGDLAFSVRDELRQGKIKGARLFTAGQGIAAKGGGPQPLADITIQVGGAADAKKTIAELADEKVDAIKLWMDDGNGKGPKLKADAYTAAIEEAHKHNLKVVSEVFDLNDAKELVKAGVNGLVSSIRDREVDDALIAAMKEKNVFLAPALTAAEAKFVYADRPNWLGEQTMREVYPPQLLGYLADPVSVNKFKRLSELGDDQRLGPSGAAEDRLPRNDQRILLLGGDDAQLREHAGSQLAAVVPGFDPYRGGYISGLFRASRNDCHGRCRYAADGCHQSCDVRTCRNSGSERCRCHRRWKNRQFFGDAAKSVGEDVEYQGCRNSLFEWCGTGEDSPDSGHQDQQGNVENYRERPRC